MESRKNNKFIKRAKSRERDVKNKNSIFLNNNHKREDSLDSFFRNNKGNYDKNKGHKNMLNIDENLKEKINILVNLYFLEKNIKSNFSKLKKNKDESKFYLIDKTWIETFKKNFDYEYIKNNLINFDESLINDIISQLLQNRFFIDKIKNKENIIIPHLYKNFTKKINISTYKFLIDYEIINDKLYKLFNNSTFLKDKLKEVDVYEINDNKIVILYKYYYINGQIGYIDENNIFIPEYLIKIIQYNPVNLEKLFNFCKNDLHKFEKNNNINIYQIDNEIFCYKIIDDICMKEKNLNVNILSIRKNKDIIIDSYGCINCDSEIEINSINICKDNTDDIIKYKCRNCGIISIILHEYLNKMILKIYLYKNCYICGNIQINDVNFKNKTINSFLFCFSCKKIFCNNNNCLFFHNLKCKKIKTIEINKMANICLNHSIASNDIIQYTWYCVNDNKNLCDICFSQDNKNHNKIYKMENIPIEINNIKEEENILQKIIEYLKQKDYKIIKDKINILSNKLKINKKELCSKLKKDIDILNNKKNDELSKLTNEYNNNIDKNKKKYYDTMTEQIKQLCESIKTLTDNISNENEINKNNDINYKHNLFNKFFDNENKIKNDNKNIISKTEEDYYKEEKNIEDNFNNKKKK